MKHPLSRPFRCGLLALAVSIAVSLQPAEAAPLYWDTNGSTVGAGGNTPSGTWDSATANWSTDSNGAVAGSAYVTGSSAVFSAGSDATGAYTVTINGPQKVSSLDFQEGHVTIAANTITDTLTLTGTTSTINVQNMDAVITARLIGDTVNPALTGYTKTGLGKLTLGYGANASSSYFDTRGATLTINGGTVEINGTASADSFNVGAVVINSGGTFRYAGPNSVSNSTVFTINTGGTLVGGGDQIGGFSGTGLIQTTGNFNVTVGSTSLVFSGLITGTGALSYTGGGATTMTLAGANTYTGTTGAQASTTSSGGIRLGHTRAIQFSTLNLIDTNAAVINISFASSIGNFIAGGLQGTSNLLLQDVGGTAVTLQAGNNDATTAYSGALTGTGGLTKIGLGTLSLAGTNTYTGDTTVNAATHNFATGSVTSANAGTLQLNFNAATAPATNIVNSSSRLVLGGARLLVSGKDNATTASQTFSSTLLNAGRSFVTVAPGTGTSTAVVNLGNIVHNAGGLVEFTLPSGPQSATNGITTTTSNTNGILGAWATIGTDWAAAVNNGTTNNIVAYTAYTVLSGTTQTIASNAANNVRIDDSGTLPATLTNGTTRVSSGLITVDSTAGLVVGQTVTGPNIPAGAVITAIDPNGTDFTISVNASTAASGQTFTVANPITLAGSGTTDINTLQSTSTGNRVVDLGTGTLRLGAVGGIWQTGATAGLVLKNGKLTAGGADNTAGELVFNSTYGNGGMRVSSVITDNGTGVVTVSKTGGGELILSSANTYTGGTFVNQGRFQITNLGALGTGTVTVTPGGQLWINAGGTFTNDLVLSGMGYGEGAAPGAIRMSGNTLGTGTSKITLAGDTRIGTNSTASTIAGKITGDYSLDFSAGGSASIFTLTNSANDFGGNLSINSVVGSGAGITSYTAYGTTPVTVKLGSTAGGGAASTFIPNGAGKGNVILTGGTSGSSTLDLNSYNETINGLVSQGTAANTFVTNNAASGTGTITLGDNDTTATFAGIIKDGATAKVAVTKIGQGVQTLGGANTYSGATAINKGILKASAANTFSPNSAITIANDPTAILDLTDFSQTIGSLAGGGAVNLGTAALTASTGAILTTGGDNTSTTYSGTIVGAGGIAKQGTGTFVLSGANTYLSTTTVNAGTLQVGLSGAGQTGTGAVTVNGTGAVLAGTGTVQGATTVIAGSLRPGDSAGSGLGRLTFSDLGTSSLTLATGGVRAELTLSGATGNSFVLGDNPYDGIQNTSLLTGAPGAGMHDSINVLGTLNLTSGGTIKLTLSGYTPVAGDVFNLFDWGAINAGTFNAATDLDLSGAPLSTGLTWNTSQFLTDGVIYVVPEPSTPLALAGGVAILLMANRRRRRARD